MNPNKIVLPVTFALFALSACGGGSSNSSPANANLEQAAATGLILDVDSNDSFATSLLLTLPNINYFTPSQNNQYVYTQPCSSGGSQDYTVNDIDGDQTVSAGDTYTIDFTSCNDDFTTYSGILHATITALSGDPLNANTSGDPINAQAWSITENIILTNLVISNAELPAPTTYNGGITFVASNTSQSITNNGSLSSSATLNGTSITETYAQYSFIRTDDGVTATTDLDTAGNVTVSGRADLSGSFTQVTNPVFSGPSNSAPTSGQIIITYPGVPVFTITAVNTGLQVQTDSNPPVIIPWPNN